MKKTLGLVMIILSIPMAFYVALWLCFIGGIVQVIEGIKASPVEAISIALGFLRIFCTSIAGWASFFLLFFPGLGLLGMSSRRKRYHN